MKRQRDNLQGGDGVQWCRREMIGEGSSGCVYLAELKKSKAKYSYFPQYMAVKSAEVSVSGLIQEEAEIFRDIGASCYIITCFGEEITNGDNGEMVYNLLLEYASGGTLCDLINKSDGSGLPEGDVRYYARSILRGISHIHKSGYVHCDIKPENILLVSDSVKAGSKFRAKIGDLGLSKRATKDADKMIWDPHWRGTSSFISPEAVMDGLQEAPSDIWAFGCVVLEMLTGDPAWGDLDDVDPDILYQISLNEEFPKIPDKLPSEGKDFLKGCLSRNPRSRMTADMLLNHKFLEGLVDDVDEDIDDAGDVIEDEGEMICTDESGVSRDDCCLITGYIEDGEYYAFDTDEIWKNEKVMDLASKGSAFDDMVNTNKGFPTNLFLQNPVVPFLVQAGA